MKLITTLYDANGNVIEPEICPICNNPKQLHLMGANGGYSQHCYECEIPKNSSFLVEYRIAFNYWKKKMKPILKKAESKKQEREKVYENIMEDFK